MNYMSFRHWLLRQHKRQDPVGHLAKDFRADYGSHYSDEPPMPPRFTYRTALDYLRSRNAGQGALDALEIAHREWRTYRGPRLVERRD